MNRVTWLGNIATTTGAIKSGGADGGGRVTLDIPDDGIAELMAALYRLRGVAVRVTIEADDVPVYGRRDMAD